MNKRVRIILSVVGLLSLCLIVPNTEARPKFRKIFQTTYETQFAGKDFGIESCTICHDKVNNNLRPRNNYGDTLAELLPKKNTTDEATIQSALKDAEEKPSAIEGKTFGDLIREGRLPASK
ncbi:hypothetical protein [Schlesneria paludicola]|uniref:hypothetical protein n=1 Tax=Schlesneria paludicola TaxID=360056 RepID=UPI0012FC260C|nr:hypothetical protein [Schlesneria paludicola]